MWDVYDGKQSDASLSPDQKSTAIKEPPGILETFAYAYFFGSFLVGPQLPLATFRAWVQGAYADPKTGGPPDSLREMQRRLGVGVSLLVLHLALTPYFPDEQFQSAGWLSAGLVSKHASAIAWYRIKLLRYQAAWLITEGVCILVGISHNGVDAKSGETKWDGLRNMRMTIFETGCSFQSIIDSFNLNTNKWAAKYVFKRLKFVGNKMFSQVATLGFLAIWHGWHLGYFTCFLGEFLTVNSEKEIVGLVARRPALDSLLRGRLWPLTWLVCKIVMLTSSCFFFLSFGLIKKEKRVPVYQALYWDGFLIYMLLWPAAYRLLKSLIPRPHKKEETKEDKKEE